MQKKKISGKFYRQVSDIHIYIDLEFIASSPPQGLHNPYLHLHGYSLYPCALVTPDSSHTILLKNCWKIINNNPSGGQVV